MTKTWILIDGFTRAYPMFIVVYSFLSGLLNNEREGQIAMVSIIREGVLQNYCGNKEDTLIIMPPLIVKKGELEEILSRIHQGLSHLKNLKNK